MRLREQPCDRCGWKYLGFHVCHDLSKPSAAERQALQEARGIIPRKHHAEKTARNSEMVDDYKSGMTFQALSDKYEVSKQTAMRVVHRAADEGLVTVRPRHYRTILVEGGA